VQNRFSLEAGVWKGWGWGGVVVAQIMYIRVSNCRNNKIEEEKEVVNET
jgi:hypothetical protein